MIWSPWLRLPVSSGVGLWQLSRSLFLSVCVSFARALALSPFAARNAKRENGGNQRTTGSLQSLTITESRRAKAAQPGTPSSIRIGRRIKYSTSGRFFFSFLSLSLVFLSLSLVKWCFRIYSSCSVDSRRIDGWGSAVFRPNKRQSVKCQSEGSKVNERANDSITINLRTGKIKNGIDCVLFFKWEDRKRAKNNLWNNAEWPWCFFWLCKELIVPPKKLLLLFVNWVKRRGWGSLRDYFQQENVCDPSAARARDETNSQVRIGKERKKTTKIWLVIQRKKKKLCEGEHHQLCSWVLIDSWTWSDVRHGSHWCYTCII